MATGRITGRLALYPNDQIRTVKVDNQELPLEVDPTAAYAYTLNDNPLYAMEIINFLRGGMFSGSIPQDRVHGGLFTLFPYQKGKIPSRNTVLWQQPRNG